MSRKKYDANLPRNLTYRKASKSFFWRNPVTDKEFPLGQIARRDAITQTIEANNFIAQNHTPVALIEKLKGTDSFTVSAWIDRYEVLLQRRSLSVNTYKIRGNQLVTVREKMGEIILAEVTTRHIAKFLESWITEGKNTMAGAMRSVLSDMFREAIVEGHIVKTRWKQPGYQRLRLPGNACNWKRVTPHGRQQSICLHGSLSRWI